MKFKTKKLKFLLKFLLDKKLKIFTRFFGIVFRLLSSNYGNIKDLYLIYFLKLFLKVKFLFELEKFVFEMRHICPL